MAVIDLVSADRVRIVGIPAVQLTLPAAEAIEAGAGIRIDPTTGRFTNANGTDAGEARVWGIATRSVAAGETVTGVRKGIIDGFDLSGLDFDDPVYLSDTDGALDDAAGTVSTVVGRVVPGTASLLGATYDKLLFVDL